MSSFKFELDRAGVRQLLKSEEMETVCRRYADGIQSRCGEGYEVTTYTGVNRVNASVIAATPDARKENLKNNTLLKAVRG